MQKIESFTIDHTKLFAGLYVSRKDRKNDTCVTTFDLRVTAPNREKVMDTPAIHTIEHLGATYLRNSERAEDIVYFGPMGCRTGFYLVMFGDLESECVYELVLKMCDFIIEFEGQIPGATAVECGNFSEQDLVGAKVYTKKYKHELETYKNFIYN